MTEPEKKARINEIGKEIADMFPDCNGSVTLDFSSGHFKGVRLESMWRPEKKKAS